MLDDHRAETATRRAVHDYLEAAERHVQAYKALEREARDRGIAVAEHPLHAEWRKAARPLLTTGRAILADEDSRPPIIVASGPRCVPILGFGAGASACPPLSRPMEGAAIAAAWEHIPAAVDTDGTLAVRFTVGGIDEICWYLVTWGDSVTVRERTAI